jgi:hypothetical protein
MNINIHDSLNVKMMFPILTLVDINPSIRIFLILTLMNMNINNSLNVKMMFLILALVDINPSKYFRL